MSRGSLPGGVHTCRFQPTISSSNFTSQATDFAKSVERVVLIDGTRLAGLMIDHEVGVQLRAVRVPKLDSDYFES